MGVEKDVFITSVRRIFLIEITLLEISVTVKQDIDSKIHHGASLPPPPLFMKCEIQECFLSANLRTDCTVFHEYAWFLELAHSWSEISHFSCHPAPLHHDFFFFFLFRHFKISFSPIDLFVWTHVWWSAASVAISCIIIFSPPLHDYVNLCSNEARKGMANFHMLHKSLQCFQNNRLLCSGKLYFF